MRSFEDATGRQWDVAVSDASYGAQCLIFAARKGNELRSHELELYSRFDAEQMLLRLDDAALRALLAGAREWQPG